MILAFGDCHAHCLFHGIPRVRACFILAMSMRRASWSAERRLPAEVAKQTPGQGDVVLLGYGELDVRRKLYSSPAALAALIAEVTPAYLDRAATLPLNGARFGVVNIIPPPRRRPLNERYIPPSATDRWRLMATLAFNVALEAHCRERGVPLVDVFARYAGEDGFLPDDKTDKIGMHVGSNAGARDALVRARLLSP